MAAYTLQGNVYKPGALLTAPGGAQNLLSLHVRGWLHLTPSPPILPYTIYDDAWNGVWMDANDGGYVTGFDSETLWGGSKTLQEFANTVLETGTYSLRVGIVCWPVFGPLNFTDTPNSWENALPAYAFAWGFSALPNSVYGSGVTGTVEVGKVYVEVVPGDNNYWFTEGGDGGTLTVNAAFQTVTWRGLRNGLRYELAYLTASNVPSAPPTAGKFYSCRTGASGDAVACMYGGAYIWGGASPAGYWFGAADETGAAEIEDANSISNWLEATARRSGPAVDGDTYADSLITWRAGFALQAMLATDPIGGVHLAVVAV